MGISFWHLLILLVIVLLIFGPQRIEGVGSSLGKAIRGFKKGLEDGADPHARPSTTDRASEQVTQTKSTTVDAAGNERVIETVEKKKENS